MPSRRPWAWRRMRWVASRLVRSVSSGGCTASGAPSSAPTGAGVREGGATPGRAVPDLSGKAGDPARDSGASRRPPRVSSPPVMLTGSGGGVRSAKNLIAARCQQREVAVLSPDLDEPGTDPAVDALHQLALVGVGWVHVCSGRGGALSVVELASRAGACVTGSLRPALPDGGRLASSTPEGAEDPS